MNLLENAKKKKREKCLESDIFVHDINLELRKKLIKKEI